MKQQHSNDNHNVHTSWGAVEILIIDNFLYRVHVDVYQSL